MNTLLQTYLEDCQSFRDLQTIIYCGALACTKLNGVKINLTHTQMQKTNGGFHDMKPKWQRRLEKKIQNTRADINRLVQYKKGNRSRRLVAHVNKIRKKHCLHTKYEENNLSIEQCLDTMKQKLTAWANRVRRYKKCTDRKRANTLFYRREGQFYRELKNKIYTLSEQQKLPSSGEIQNYWSNIWPKEKKHDSDAQWIVSEKNRTKNMECMNYENISLDLLRITINNTHNWKAAGVDKIHNFWYKKFVNTHELLLRFINYYIKNPEDLPEYFTMGVTYLLPKDNHQLENPSKYRPITCLPTIYKILTGCVTNLLDKHCQTNNIIAENQKGCSKNSRGCKEQLTIDNIIMEQAFRKNRNLYTAYIDYQKAYDSVPHSWLLHVLKIYKCHPTIITFLEKTMQKWKTKIKLHIHNTCITTSTIQIKSGIFQGDSLSPLWFCLALNPLSSILNNTNKGYSIRHNNKDIYRITHLSYMDDIKLYASTSENIHDLLTLTTMFSDDIGMRFGLDKCKTQSVRQGKLHLNEYSLGENVALTALNKNEVYTYLGIQQSRRIQTTKMKKEIREKYLERVKSLSESLLNSRNLFKAINTYAIPVLTYSFGIIKWTITDLEEIQRETRIILTNLRHHHPKSAVERLTLPRCKGGRGLIDILNLKEQQIRNLRAYFLEKGNTSIIHKAVVKADKNYSPLDLSNTNVDTVLINDDVKFENWKQKALHGKYPNELKQPGIDFKSSVAWMVQGQIFSETEGFFMAIQDQVIKTKNYQKFILQDGTTDDKCRRCKTVPETIHHIISGCQTVTQTDYKKRHDNVAKILYQAILKKCNIQFENQPYYKYYPEKIYENNSFRIYWDRAIITDKSVKHNRPDILLWNKEESICYFIDIAVPSTQNLEKTYVEKVQRYIELAIEIKSQWKIATVETIPILLSATGVIPETMKTSLAKLGVSEELFKPMQKSVILDTCNAVRKFLNFNF